MKRFLSLAISNFLGWVLCEAGVLTYLIAMFFCCSCMRISDYPASNTFKGYFKTPITQIQDLKGNGTTWQGHDVYINFQSDSEIALKDQSDYETINPETAILYFLQKFPEEAQSLKDKEDLVCLFNKGKKKSPGSNGEWLLINQKSKHYFFRSWWIT